MATVIQLPLLFIGIDLADTGFYMTFYDQIFRAPGSVEYNFMYYLTGVVGGLWHSVWPGILSLRVLGVLVNLWTVWVLTRMVSDWRAVLLSVAVILFGLYRAPLTFNYDTLTSALTVTGLWFMCRGAVSWKWPLAAGIVMGINVFSRISNLAGLGYVLFFFITSIWHGRRAWRGAAWYLAGWIAGVLSVLLLMAVLGHLHIFESNLKELFLIAGASDTEASHGMGNLISAQIGAWWRIFKFTCVAGILLWIYVWLRKSVSNVTLKVGLLVPVVLAGAYVVYRAVPLTVVAGLSLLGCCAALFCRKLHLRDVAVAGLLMMFIMPLGSDGGIYNGGTLVVWVSMTAATACFIDVKGARIRWLIPGPGVVAVSLSCLCLLMIVQTLRFGVYFDDSHIGDRLATVRNQTACTSETRARLIDSLVDDLNRFVQPGDTLMVYGSGPTLNYLTRTRPWLGCSWPEQFMSESLRRHLQSAAGHPVIAVLKFNTLGSAFGSPSEDFAMGDMENIYHNRDKSAVIYEYLDSHGYSPVCDSEYMVIYR